MKTTSLSKGTSRLEERRRAQQGRTAHGDERRQELIQTAYRLIAEKGVGGLRTRDVAALVGINTATLHYYFPTKEHLLQAVAQQLGYAFTTSPAPGTSAGDGANTPSEQMEAYFASLAYQLRTTPERFVVMNELFFAASRDERLAGALEVDTHWQAYLNSILEEGVKQGSFRSDLNVEQTALTIIAFCKGLPLLQSQPDSLDKIITSFKNWFFSMTATAIEKRTSSRHKRE
ncbi:hypothetical protein KDH_22820 [Dictyobacter sp. S3.2.2.5]|uniref:HTH tetR-type domain-containing protein n=1 Tax=Dictyobacter halimunensis TaxID=3026934 RepID=A0ABQ6FMH4_9CHLR|nr:hypothetical protein KDH_22820 [Dictyobacter sp. S3.2.2.5]